MTTPRPTPNPATSTKPERSSKRVAHKKPLGWLPGALLLALLALLALVFLIINAVDDDGPEGPAGDSLGQVSSGDGSSVKGSDGNDANAQPSDATDQSPAPTDTQPTQPAGAPPSQPAGAQATQPAAGGGTGADAQLKVAEQDLLGLTGGSLADQAGKPVTGSAKVESVVTDEGFWVGSSKTARTFVYLTPQARKANGESTFQVKAGQTVQLTGQMTTPQTTPKAVAGITAAEGLAQLTKQGAFVSAETIELAG